MAVIHFIRDDKRAKKLLRMLNKGSFAFDCPKFIKEIQFLHSKRKSRDIKVSDVMHRFQSSFLESVLQTQEYRTRIVEIKMQAFIIHARLDKHTSLVKQHLRSNYSEQLNRISGTAADRDNLLNTILAKAVAHLKDLKTVIDVGDLAINDLDQAGWSNKSVINVMEQVNFHKTAKV